MTEQYKNPLPVKYYSQRDSVTGHSYRMCYSSSNAMLLNFLVPGLLTGDNGDDQYLYRVLQFGDTTDPAAQEPALASFLKGTGITAKFRQDLTWTDIDAQLAKGIPVPIGILHHGHVSNPKGGHWIVIIGKTADGKFYIVHDPFGELDLISGDYVSTKGGGLKYSKENLGKRWLDKNGHGWGFFATKPTKSSGIFTPQKSQEKPKEVPVIDNQKHWAWPLADELNKAGVLNDTSNLDKPLTKGEVLALMMACVTKQQAIAGAAEKARARVNG